jgi:hypothetical protein
MGRPPFSYQYRALIITLDIQDHQINFTPKPPFVDAQYQLWYSQRRAAKVGFEQ